MRNPPIASRSLARAALSALLLTAAACDVPPEADVEIDEGEHAIVGGEEIPQDSFIGKRTIGLLLNGRPHCTATILDGSHALTAAHCVLANGNYRVSFSANMDRGPFRNVTRRWAHPSYNTRGDYHHDIGVVEFAGGLPPGQMPVTLATFGTPNVRNGAAVVHAGFGATAPNGAGVGRLRKTTGTIRNLQPVQQEILTDRVGHTTCYGDSGGPTFTTGPVTHQVGVSSVTFYPYCRARAEVTDVRYYIDWIRSTGASPAL